MSTSQDLLPHMRHVLNAERDLRDLALVWQMIESSATISCPVEAAPILPTLVNIRERFESLQARLVDKLVDENREQLGDELTAVAQCAIDILVRNLYERTADVGFLATDGQLAAFCAADPPARDAQREALRARLRSYQAKYTVYDDIVLVAPDGNILARLDGEQPLTHSREPLIARALRQGAGYLERFGASDLAAGPDPVLLYAHTVSDAHGATVAVLVLRFRLADELQRIFDSMDDERHERALVLIDANHRVIASNDTAHVALGALLRPPPPGRVGLTTFGGREYAAVCCPSPGYQGYAGPGWRAMAMVSLLTAFRRSGDNGAADTTEILAPLDNPALTGIANDAGSINRELRRTVWNGRLMAAAKSGDRLQLKAVLAQVHQAGNRTRSRVSEAIRDLYVTALARARSQAQALAQLAADILDRNLYERANDCRWWAESPAIRAALEAPPGRGESAELNRVLDHVNRLYTVYSRLIVFDADGAIRGVSRLAEGGPLARTAVPAAWLQAVRGLQDGQRYAVSGFEAPDLVPDHAPTYVYLAAVRVQDGQGPVVGGVAVVFNAAVEFDAMLRDVLGDQSGFAAFIDAAGQVIACTDARWATAPAPTFDGSVAQVAHDGVQYVCARVPTQGYREFKREDGYDHGVQVVVGLRLGTTERRRHSLAEIELHSRRPPLPDQGTEAAIFSVGPHRYALPSASVMMAVPPDGLVRLPGGTDRIGLLEVKVGEQRQTVPVLCARQRFGVGYPARSTDGLVLVLRHPTDPQRPGVGVRVDDVLAVLEVHDDDRHPLPVAQEGPRTVSALLDCVAQVASNTAPTAALVQWVEPQVFSGIPS